MTIVAKLEITITADGVVVGKSIDTSLWMRVLQAIIDEPDAPVSPATEPTKLVVRSDSECEECGEDIGCECDARVRLGPCDACEKHECGTTDEQVGE